MSKIWIIPWVENLTGNWHPEGGLVIIADNLSQAKELVKNYKENTREGINSNFDLSDPNHSTYVYKLLGKQKPQVWVFPDAGCC